MSIAGIAASSFFSGAIAQSSQKLKQTQEEFQKLGQDLQAGKLAEARADFAKIQAPASQPHGATPAGRPGGTFAQSLHSLAQDLKLGNLGGAPVDFKLPRDAQPEYGDRPLHFHYRQPSDPTQGGPTLGSPTQGSPSPGGIDQLLNRLGQELQAGNLTSARQSYASLLQDFQQFGATGAVGGGTAAAPASVSFSA